MPSNDFDIHEFARLLDAALTSDNPSVKKALRNFMLIAAIAESENTKEDVSGPFNELFKKYEALHERVVSLELDAAVRKSQEQSTKKYTPPPYSIDQWTNPPSTWSVKSELDNELMKKYLFGTGTTNTTSSYITNKAFKGIIDPGCDIT